MSRWGLTEVELREAIIRGQGDGLSVLESVRRYSRACPDASP